MAAGRLVRGCPGGMASGAVGTAVGLSGDLRTGTLVRFRTLPMAPIAVLAARTHARMGR